MHMRNLSGLDVSSHKVEEELSGTKSSSKGIPGPPKDQKAWSPRTSLSLKSRKIRSHTSGFSCCEELLENSRAWRIEKEEVWSREKTQSFDKGSFEQQVPCWEKWTMGRPGISNRSKGGRGCVNKYFPETHRISLIIGIGDQHEAITTF
jgi:hypothetical protein